MIETVTGTEKEAIQQLLAKSFQEGDSVALWKEPHQQTKHLIISKALQEIEEAELSDLASGFIVAPFQSEKKKFFFPADWHFTIAEGTVKSSITNRSEYNTQEFSESKPFRPYTKPQPLSVHGAFSEMVERAVQKIESGQLEKVVPSRFKDIVLPDPFDILKTFDALGSKYPNALISFISSPTLGTWIGATPELLVSVDDKMVFKTVALAGTLPYHEGMDLKSVAWTQKEIEEQALVTRYIINCFKKIRLREYDEHGPKTIIAGNLLHLKTEYAVDMNAVNFPNLGSVMLKLLHPTSAVCGMPLAAAREFLQEHEGYDRELYSGYLGPVNVKQTTSIYVNLRCMQLFDNHARLYAGAGVTADSVAGKELEETEMKMNTLLNIITQTP